MTAIVAIIAITAMTAIIVISDHRDDCNDCDHPLCDQRHEQCAQSLPRKMAIIAITAETAIAATIATYYLLLTID